MTTKSKRVYVLVDDDQVPLSPSDVAAAVSEVGFYRAAERYGYADTTLRAFLAKNGVKARTTIVYEKDGEQLYEGASPYRKSTEGASLTPENQEALDTAVAVVTQLGG